MELMEFQKLKETFKTAEVDKKINIYTTSQGLTQSQYRELLQYFPVNEIPALEAALKG